MKEFTTEQFSSRWGIILASLGMAIGAGNLWRFPRLAGQYGGAFIILWILFLFIWSIPLLLAEFSIGKKFRKGVIGSYGELTGKKYTFLGFFIAFCTLGIAFYYSVVTAWALRYLGLSITHVFSSSPIADSMAQNPDYLNQFWLEISNGSAVTILVFIAVIFVATYVLSKGIKNGLEKANRILIPTLFVLLLIVCVVALNMENGVLGLEYMFSIDPKLFSQPNIWIEAVSQSAWSTGAGWGLLITLSSYSKKNEDVTLNTFIGAFGNNTASLLAGIAILPAVFAMSVSEGDAIGYLQSGNQALVFTIIPKLFANVYVGDLLSTLFFLALFLAAFSSLLPMIELFVSNVVRMGVSRKKSMILVIVVFITAGFPSVYNLDFFSNQDWVWGIGLILSGLFIAFAVVKYGLIKFKTELIDEDSDFKVSLKYFAACILINLLMGVVLIYWWLSRGYSTFPWFDENGHWNLFDVYSNATVLTQWGVVLFFGFLINRFLYKKIVSPV